MARKHITVYECNNLYFYQDIINSRNLEPTEFFKLLNEKYHLPYPSIISRKIDQIAYNISLSKANKLKLVVDYKRACLKGDIEKVNELEKKFKSIQDVVIHENSNSNSINQTLISKTKPNDIHNFPKKKRENSQFITKCDTKEEIEKLTELVINKNDVNELRKKDLDDIIKVLKYFLYNINLNLHELTFCQHILVTRRRELYSYNRKLKVREENLINSFYDSEEKKKQAVDEIKSITKEKAKILSLLYDYGQIVKNIHIVGEDKLDEKRYSDSSYLCTWKITKLKKYKKVYSQILEEIIAFKKAVSFKNADLEKIKISKDEIDEEFIKEILSDILLFLNGYKNIRKVMTSDKKQESIREEYIKRLYKD